MKRINMTKYGFIRNEREDFHDDGNNFKGYATGKIKKVKYDGLNRETELARLGFVDIETIENLF